MTIDIALRSDADVSGETAFGVGGAAFGYDESVVSFQLYSAVSSLLVQACVPSVGCSGGVNNSVVAAAGPALSLLNPLGPEIQFLNAALTSGSAFTGASDEGVNGLVGSAQLRLVFQAAAVGTSTIELGASEDYGDALILAGGFIGATNSDFVTLTVIPEPGTAFLLSLGLMGLAGARPRNSQQTKEWWIMMNAAAPISILAAFCAFLAPAAALADCKSYGITTTASGYSWDRFPVGASGSIEVRIDPKDASKLTQARVSFGNTPADRKRRHRNSSNPNRPTEPGRTEFPIRHRGRPRVQYRTKSPPLTRLAFRLGGSLGRLSPTPPPSGS